MGNNTGLLLDPKVVLEILHEIYQKGNQDHSLIERQVIQEIIDKLQLSFAREKDLI